MTMSILSTVKKWMLYIDHGTKMHQTGSSFQAAALFTFFFLVNLVDL